MFAAVVLILPMMFPLLAPDYPNGDQQLRRSSVREVLKSFTFPRNAPDFYFALASRLVILLGFNAVAGYQLYILTDYVALTPGEAGSIITRASLITLVAAFAGSFVFGPLSDRIRRRKAIVILGALLMAAGILILLVAAAPWAFLTFAGLAGVGMGIFLSVDAALLSEVLPNDETRGKDLGILNLSGSAGQVLAPAVSAAIIGIGFGFAPVFVIGAALSLAGAALIMPIKKVR
ncbi:MAG TPA: MFS transporter [Actinotalea sp.]|nr:MFS transporter [Actinotalea sp.]